MPMPSLRPLLRGLTLAAGLCLLAPAHAETWPDADWQSGPAPSGPALQAFEAYAFPARDDATRPVVWNCHRWLALLLLREITCIVRRGMAAERRQLPLQVIKLRAHTKR